MLAGSVGLLPCTSHSKVRQGRLCRAWVGYGDWPYAHGRKPPSPPKSPHDEHTAWVRGEGGCRGLGTAGGEGGGLAAVCTTWQAAARGQGGHVHWPAVRKSIVATGPALELLAGQVLERRARERAGSTGVYRRVERRAPHICGGDKRWRRLVWQKLLVCWV